MTEEDKTRSITGLIACMFAAFGTGLAIICTYRYGAGLSPDSIQYISCARNLINGKGFINYGNNPFVHWPPLFPLILWALGKFGIDPLNGARFVNAASFGAIILASAYIFLNRIRSRPIALFAISSVALSLPLLHISVMAWTEPVFVLLTLLFYIYIERFLERDGILLLFSASFIAALSCLQRYAGIAVALTGILLLLFGKAHPAQKSRNIGIFAAISLTPIFIWIMKNYLTTSTFTGPRPSSSFKLISNIHYFIDVITIWFIPEEIRFLPRVAALCLFFFIIIATSAFLLHTRPGKKGVTVPVSIPNSVVFFSVYSLFILTTSSLISIDRISDRFLSPLYVFVMLAAFTGIDAIYGILTSTHVNKRLSDMITIGVCAFWLIYPATRIIDFTSTRILIGGGGFNTAKWHDSRLIEWLKSRPPQGRIYSNAPDGIYIIANMSAHRLPPKKADLGQFIRSIPPNEDILIIWFNNVRNSYLHDINEIGAVIKMRELISFPDGKIYIIKKSDIRRGRL